MGILLSLTTIAGATDIAVPPGHSAVAKKTATATYKIVGYYLARPDLARKYTLDNIKASKLTHLNYAFAAIHNGEVALDAGIPIEQSKDDFAKLAKLKRSNSNLKILISIGGWGGSKEFSNVALTEDSRSKFADSAVVFIRNYGLDGVDIDWEYPVAGGDEGNIRRPEDKQNYTLLFQALRDKLNIAGKKDHHTYLLTTAMGSNQPFLENTEMNKVAAILDWANMMTYDFSGHWNKYAGHNAPLYSDPVLKHGDSSEKSSISAIVDLALKAGIPANKLVLGLPFYGYSWKQCGPANNGQLQDCQGNGRGTWEEGTLDFSDIDQNLVNKKGFVRYWNDTVKAPYLFNTDTGEFITYDDVESLDYKIKYLKAQGLGGAMFWEITGDRNFVLQNKLAHDLLGK
jgi:chitinase